MKNDRPDLKVKILEWDELDALAKGGRILVERVALPDQGVHIEGRFELPQLAKLSGDDQVFVAAFIRSHGSIKEMEQTFGVSYPTIKARLHRIADSLQFVEKVSGPSKSEILERLNKGQITAKQAIDLLEKMK